MLTKLIQRNARSLARLSSQAEAKLKLDLDTKGYSEKGRLNYDPGNVITWQVETKAAVMSKTVSLQDQGKYWIVGFRDSYLQTIPVLR